MKLLDSIRIQGNGEKRVELYEGDLTEVEQVDEFDLLVISAFPNDYIPTPSSLIGALYRKGLSVGKLASDKDIDLREAYSCWLSKDLKPEHHGLVFKRILCFEPQTRGRPPEVVGDIFRALTPILADCQDIQKIAMPVVAAGDQGYSITEMLEPLLDAAIHWLEIGLPLTRIKIVTRNASGINDALSVFNAKKNTYIPSEDLASQANPEDEQYDVFISYSRRNSSESSQIEQSLRDVSPGLKIFVDRQSLNIGSAWQPEIFETLDRCKKVVALLSPDYLGSKVCKEEFNIAWIRARETEHDIIFPIYLYTAPLPTYMKYLNFFDCREGDASRFDEAARLLVNSISKV